MNWLFFIPGLVLLIGAILIGTGYYSQRKAGESPPRVVRTAGLVIAALGVLFIILAITF
ncbi:MULTISPECIES: hypothetical protein [Novosphingopyxis]|uniref:hypothetical protein n=1 Tax=Novosphingopyxis TaxID=2709686 RepID=UPI00165158F2|nr:MULTISPECIES: hypothetical protein [Novosphingopyxis]MBH9536728.1 hypothetical protein [Novosphingopyxis sp. YJ-S2-01]